MKRENETQFTAGPWTMVDRDIYTKWTRGDKSGQYRDDPTMVDNVIIGSVATFQSDVPEHEVKANAALIAAAPDLFEACMAAEANLAPIYSSDHHVMQLLRTAIRKASTQQENQ